MGDAGGGRLAVKKGAADKRTRARSARDRELARGLLAWFMESRREMPWRTAPGVARDPYAVLVSETMLQQTQVNRVERRFEAFMRRFPDVGSLAGASADEVMGAWAGLGYYRRARNLHAAARMIVERFGGRVPGSVEDLMSLPGVGRYTAGAVVSIAFGVPAPAVDGNVQRVLMRIEGIALTTDSRAAQRRVWERAAELARAADDPCDWTEALMELGATLCVPKTPRCDACPVSSRCRARAEGTASSIPRPRPRPVRRSLFVAAAVVTDAMGRVLVERRPERGLWGGLWQVPTLERSGRAPTAGELREALGVSSLRETERFERVLTHRRVHVRVYRAEAGSSDTTMGGRGRFVSKRQASSLGLSSLQRRVLFGETGRRRSDA